MTLIGLTRGIVGVVNVICYGRLTSNPSLQALVIDMRDDVKKEKVAQKQREKGHPEFLVNSDLPIRMVCIYINIYIYIFMCSFIISIYICMYI